MLLGGTLLVMLAFEGALRWFLPIGDPFITNTPSLALVFHPHPDWIPNTVSPARYTTDEHGFRVSHPIRYRAKPSGTFRVFLIGGAETENLYIDDARTFGAILERKLNQVLRPQGRGAEVINAGRTGTVSADHFYVAWRVTAYQPDAIVYLMGGDDMIPYLRNGFGPEATEMNARIRSSLFTSQLVRLGYLLFQPTAAGRFMDESGEHYPKDRERRQRAPVRPMPEQAMEVSESYRNNIRRLLTLHRRQRLPAIFMTQPALWQAAMAPDVEALLTITFNDEAPFRYSPEDLERVMNAYNDVLRTEVAAEPPAHLVDLARLLPKNGATFFTDVHLTDPPQEKIAEVLFAALVGSDLLQ